MPLEANGSNQYLAKSEFPANLGLSNAWTLSFWVKPRPSSEAATLFAVGGLREENAIVIRLDPLPQLPFRKTDNKSPTNLVTMIKGPNGTIVREIKWENFTTADSWIHGALTWDGNILQVYASGIATNSGVVLQSGGGITMTDSPQRKIFYGSSVLGNQPTFSGFLGHLAMWNSILTQDEISLIADNGFFMDLTANSGTYTSSVDLVMYYRPGDNPNNLGQDFSGVGLDLNNIRNITIDDIVNDLP